MTSIDFRWRNFRAFEDTGWIRLKPFTVIVGANNTGKTSLYSPLLALKQTQLARRYKPDLQLTGPYVDLGNFPDSVFAHNLDQSIEFGFRFPASHHDDDREPPPWERASEVWMQFAPSQEAIGVDLKDYKILDRRGRILLGRRRLKSGRYSLRGEVWRSIASSAQERQSDHLRDWMDQCKAEQPRHYMFEPEAFFDVLSQLVSRELAKTDEPEQATGEASAANDLANATFPIATYNMTLEAAAGVLKPLIFRLSYLGPLRAQPARWYQLSEEPPGDVGVRGERTAELLFRSRNSPLLTNVHSWLQRFGIANELTFKTGHRQELFSARVNSGKGGTRRSINWADTGFGASQLLPIIAQALLPTPQDLFITQQPEIHLNPALQCLLPDLLSQAREHKKYILVETHSEHFVMRLRTLVAQGHLTADDINLIYVERGDSGQALARSVEIGDNGQIDPSDWPADFFGESFTQAMELAMAQADTYES